MAPKQLSRSCPCCGSAMQVVAMGCGVCNVKIEGPFGESIFTRLEAEDQQFLLDYLLSGFSIKALEETSNMGYMAIRTRLDKLIGNTRSLLNSEIQKKAILEKLRGGEITVAEAKKQLERIQEV